MIRPVQRPMRLLQRGRATALLALLVLCVPALVGCSSGGNGAAKQPVPDGWTSFGSFQRAAQYANKDDLPGPAPIKLPDGGIASLDAEQLLGSGLKLPVRENYEIIKESYLYTADADVPVIVGLVQTKRLMYFRGYTEYEFVTFVLGISAEEKPRELTRTRIVRGGEHTASFAGRSDLGVVSIYLQGLLDPNNIEANKVMGVDAVRGTDVWEKNGGFAAFGEHTATFLVAASPEACATEIQRYNVANGNVIDSEKIDNTDPTKGGICQTAGD